MPYPEPPTINQLHDMTETQIKSLKDLPALDGDDDQRSASVHGRLIRRRNLSKGLVFGDIQLKDGGLLELMIQAKEGGVLDFAAIRQINWNVHLGDIITACGILQRKPREPGRPMEWLFVVRSIQVDELWSLHHDKNMLNYTMNTDLKSTTTSVAVVKTNKYTNMVILDGFNTCKYFFSSSGGTNCLRGEQCHFWHGPLENFKTNQRRWIAKRLEQRANAAHLAGDSSDPHSKVEKVQRSRLFCDWLVASMGEARLAAGTGVIDVAGGKGDIPIQLWIQRGIPTTLVDPRPMKLGKYNRRLVKKADNSKSRKMSPQLLCCLDDKTLLLHMELFTNCSMLVGMHPDEATEAIVNTALMLGKPFAIVPCCVMSRKFPDRQCQDGTPVDTYDTFVTYLMEKHPSIKRAFLPFIGRNQVLYLFDYHQMQIHRTYP
ncbi:hypothetical protein CCR75_000018 [Bremia lactucae]|uniref:C3H1-type domain-containing protein n=1 Tax=Bremia lactucae TaxID=4779 RepID=A0A976IJP7_BRELC|nr:hypothetical protein CCR75_000018 [Bremia lactucae]